MGILCEDGLLTIPMEMLKKIHVIFFFLLAGNATTHAQEELTNKAETITILAAGDIARCPATGAELTAQLIEQLPGTVLALGDLAYEKGTPKEFRDCYHPTWGRFKERTYPAPGNHEYESEAVGYFQYWGKRARPKGKSYYSFDLGTWHIIALDSNLKRRAAAEQEAWLRRDLAATKARCILGFWHHSTFSSGWHGPNSATLPLFRILYEGGASIVLAGHDHHYERFAPQDADAKLDEARGIRSFVVGTGGAKMYPVMFRRPNSATYHTGAWGVVQLTLGDDRYDWEFVPAETTLFQDKGSGVCVDRSFLMSDPEVTTHH
jgi:acid phosphatase type 7